MRTLKSVFGVIGALVAVIYCGSLLYYFLDLSGSLREAESDGLMPTLLGLGTIGLLFFVLLIMRVVRIFGGPRSSGSGGRGGPDASTHNGKDEFDADAAVARYLARRSAEAASGSPAAPPACEAGGPARPPSFGRKVR